MSKERINWDTEDGRIKAVEIAKTDSKICEGDLEIDSDAKVSWLDEDETDHQNGAYVSAWLWVSFEGTGLSRGEDDETD